MAVDDAARMKIEAFRQRFREKYAGDARFQAVEDADREDGSSLATRFKLADHLWLEMCLRPHIPQLRAGIVTDDRWISEDLEQVIEDSGDTMSEFVELGFEEAGLEWPEPPVEHYREAGRDFYFSTGFELDSLDALDDPQVFEKICRMFDGYYEAFKPAIEKLASST